MIWIVLYFMVNGFFTGYLTATTKHYMLLTKMDYAMQIMKTLLFFGFGVFYFVGSFIKDLNQENKQRHERATSARSRSLRQRATLAKRNK
jgi:hypothetical protein